MASSCCFTYAKGWRGTHSLLLFPWGRGGCRGGSAGWLQVRYHLGRVGFFSSPLGLQQAAPTCADPTLVTISPSRGRTGAAPATPGQAVAGRTQPEHQPRACISFVGSRRVTQPQRKPQTAAKVLDLLLLTAGKYKMVPGWGGGGLLLAVPSSRAAPGKSQRGRIWGYRAHQHVIYSYLQPPSRCWLPAWHP